MHTLNVVTAGTFSTVHCSCWLIFLLCVFFAKGFFFSIDGFEGRLGSVFLICIIYYTLLLVIYML